MYNIYKIRGRYKMLYMSCATEEEAREICEDMNWSYTDDKGFQWTLILG